MDYNKVIRFYINFNRKAPPMRTTNFHSKNVIKRGPWARVIACGMSIILCGVLQVAHGTLVTTAGGGIVSIVNNSAGIYAGTSEGVFTSTDSGKTWSATDTGLTNEIIYQIIASVNGTLYVRTGAGLFGSTDNAQTWTGLDTSTDQPLGLKSFTVNSAGNVFALGTAGLYKSTDNGTSWTLVSPGFGTISIDTGKLTVSGYTPFVYAGPAGSIYATGWGDGLYRSTDGATWTMIDSTLKGGSLVAVVAGAGAEAFIATGDKAGVYRSIDNGVTWKKMSIGLLETKVYGIVYNSAGDALAGTADGVYRFVKNGDEWRKTNTLLADTIVNAVAVTTGYVLAGTLSTGEIFRMVDAFNPPADPAPVHFDSLPGYTFLTSFKVPSGPFLLGTNRGAFRSADTGKTWYRLPNGMGSDTTSVTAFAYAGTRLYAVAYGSLYRSADNGNRWVSLQRSPDAKGIVGGTGGRIVTSSATSEGFAYSDDNGITWVKTYSESLNKTFASNSSGTMYALGSSVYRSTNNGTSWTKTCANPFSGYVSAGQITSGGAIVVSTESGIYRSSDSGATFALRTSGLGGFTATNDGVIAVSSHADVFTLVGGKLYRMTSSDTAWKQQNQGPFSFLAQSEDGTPYTVDRIGKFAPVSFISPHQGNWYLCDTLASIKTWEFAVAPSGSVFAATDSGLYKSADKGATWSHITVLSASPTRRVDGVIALPTGTILINYYSILTSTGSDYGVYRSTNDGATWTNVSGANAFVVSDFIAGPSGTVYAEALLAIALYRSTDSGATWTITNPKGNGCAMTLPSNFVVTSSGMFFASDSGIYRSVDKGDSWTRVSKFTNQALSGSNIKSGVTLGGSPSSSALYACADSGIYQSKDNGATWQNINRVLVNLSTMFISPQGYLFVGKWGLANQDSTVGLHYSADQGATWLCLTKDLSYRDVSNATCGPQGDVYTAFGNIQGGTAYRYTGTLVPLGIKKPGAKRTPHVTLFGAHPNPFRAMTWISYSVNDKSEMVSLHICNVAGQVVKKLLDCQQAAGEYRVAWDAHNDRGAPVVDGTYIYRLSRNGEISNGKIFLSR
jgi:photosystem II stability/assembly factor-like uncharacterized protein